jgi:hypothetical protein
MSINPTDIDHLLGDTLTMPPLHIYSDSQGQVRLLKRAPVRHEAFAAHTAHVQVVQAAPRRTQIEQFAWDRADWFTEKWTAFVDAEGDSLTPIFDEVKREQEERAKAAPMTMTRLRKMKVADLREWVRANIDPDLRRDEVIDAASKYVLLHISRDDILPKLG